MKIRYLILAHKNPAQFARLISALETPAAFFYVHIDRRACADDFRKSLADTKGRVHFLEERYYVNWGGFSTVLATLALMKECLQESLPDDRVVLLSGQDYPIKLPFLLTTRKRNLFPGGAFLPRHGRLRTGRIGINITGLLILCTSDMRKCFSVGERSWA